MIFCFYGYYLRSSGSAIYARELTRSLNAHGEDVILFSQENKPELFDFISEAYEIKCNHSRDRLVRIFSREKKYGGKTIHIKPDLKGFLPVYVYDSYPDYEKVKTFNELDQSELEGYRQAISSAIEIVLENFKVVPESILIHHLVPLPWIVQSCLPDIRQVVVFHGSDLNFAIKESALMRKIFTESLPSIRSIVVLADAGRKDILLNFKGIEGSLPEILTIPPGVDLHLFRPSSTKAEAEKEFKEAFSRFDLDIEVAERRRNLINELSMVKDIGEISEFFRKIEELEAFKQPEPELADFMRAAVNFPLITFAGKYLWTKGPVALLLAMPYVWEQIPEARVLLIGYGGSRGIIEKVRQALSSGDIDLTVNLIKKHREIDPGSREGVLLDAPVVFAEKLAESNFRGKYEELLKKRAYEEQVFVGGYLDHKRLAPLIAASDVFVAPSVFRESFGLVLIEAAACGVIPVASCHSGFKSVLSELTEYAEVDQELLCEKHDENFVENLASSIIESFRVIKKDNEILKRKLRSFVKERYSWSSAGNQVLRLLKDLPET